MYELYPYFTNDGSVGLFSPDADDIYHSTYGALSEAYEKFILPADLEIFFKKNSEIKILDICFGIGYNSKSFLNFFHEKIYGKISYSDTIGDNNIKYNDKLYGDNKKFKIFIHAIDTDKNLALLSPFFVTDKKNIKNNSLSFEHEKIQRMLSKNTSPNFLFNKEINILLFEKIFGAENFGKNYSKEDLKNLEELLYSKKYSQYFDAYMRGLYEFYKSETYKTNPLTRLCAFIHNIYYRYLSTCYKNAMNAFKMLDFDFKLSIEEAREAIKNDKNKYNYIFLDAFTPAKCPCLWTVDFFKLLFERLESGGMILTYSNSASVRNAFLQAGFKVGKIYSSSAKKFTGTAAVKNCCSCTFAGEGAGTAGEGELIYQLSEYDLGLLKTRAGIFYRDENLSLDNEAILKAHKKEVENSNLMSSSKYIRQMHGGK